MALIGDTMKSLLMKPPMIKATVEGRKTVTRRVIKGIDQKCDGIVKVGDCWQLKWCKKLTQRFPAGLLEINNLKSRYQVGEVVYIKEAWEIEQIEYPMAEISYVSDVYGDDDHDVCIINEKLPTNLDRVQSPLFMPKCAARTHILIENICIEKLNLPLSERDLEQEGGEPAIEYLSVIDGKWVFVYQFKLISKNGVNNA